MNFRKKENCPVSLVAVNCQGTVRKETFQSEKPKIAQALDSVPPSSYLECVFSKINYYLVEDIVLGFDLFIFFCLFSLN